jgi:hypothetical protein
VAFLSKVSLEEELAISDHLISPHQASSLLSYGDVFYVAQEFYKDVEQEA